MIIIGGEKLNLECMGCERRYSHIIGYGPICPTPKLRRESLRKYPPKCPKCGSRSYKLLGLLDYIRDWFK